MFRSASVIYNNDQLRLFLSRDTNYLCLLQRGNESKYLHDLPQLKKRRIGNCVEKAGKGDGAMAQGGERSLDILTDTSSHQMDGMAARSGLVLCYSGAGCFNSYPQMFTKPEYDTEHTIFSCPRLDAQRLVMFTEVGEAVNADQSNHGVRRLLAKYSGFHNFCNQRSRIGGTSVRWRSC